jgi:hypothetical protein
MLIFMSNTEAQYSEDYHGAGRRLFTDGVRLFQGARYATATHVLGLAAECAIKECMNNIPGGDRDLPRKHLPELIDDAKLWFSGRRKSGMAQLLKSRSYMAGWRIENRYWSDEAFDDQSCQRYLDDARRTLIAGGISL